SALRMTTDLHVKAPRGQPGMSRKDQIVGRAFAHADCRFGSELVGQAARELGRHVLHDYDWDRKVARQPREYRPQRVRTSGRGTDGHDLDLPRAAGHRVMVVQRLAKATSGRGTFRLCGRAIGPTSKLFDLGNQLLADSLNRVANVFRAGGQRYVVI